MIVVYYYIKPLGSPSQLIHTSQHSYNSLSNMSKDINAESIWIFSALDKLMGNHKNNPAVFFQLFEKKKLMIGLLHEKKIDAKKYMKIVGKGIKDPDPLIVSCATSDTRKLKDSKDEEMINQWFKEMIDSTGAFYDNQESLYKKYQNAGKSSQIKAAEVQKTQPIKVQPKKVNPPEPITKTSLIGGVNPDEIVSFKVIDSLLDQNDENKQAFDRYLQSKRKLLELVNNNSITADKYKAIIISSKEKTKNKDIADDIQFQLDAIEDFHDGNANAWFKDVVKETKDNLKEQEKHLLDLQKGKSVKKSKEIQLTLDQDEKIKDSAPVDLKEVNTFKAIDDQLMLEEENKVNYRILLDKKRNLLDLKKKGALTAEKYKAMLEKALTQVKNQQVKDSIEMELTLIEDMHDGNLKAWFEDVISSAEMFLQDQIKTLAELEKVSTSKKKVVEEEELIDEEETHDMKKKPSNKAENATVTKVLIDFKELYSLKAIDQYLEEYEKTPEIFCLCFQRKLAIFQMMKNGEITPAKYKDLQVKTFKETKNEKLKDIVEMDLLDLKEMSNNDANDWFQSLINDSGEKYEEQEVLYKKWNKKPQTSQKTQPSNISSSISVSNKESHSMMKIDEKPIINDVVCFTAIVKLFIFAVERVDIVYYKELEIKRGKLIDLTTQKKLVSAKYREINKAAASKTTNVFLKNTILEEQARLKGQFKGNEQAWFQSLVTVLNAAPPELKLPENKEIRRLNNSSTPKKADFFLRRMAIYECLFLFFKRSKIPIETNKYLQEYEKSKRKEVYHCLEMIHKDPSLDVYNLSTQMFPDITSDIFYGDNLVGLKKRAESYIPALIKEIAAQKDYTSKIKRSSNIENIQTAKKEIAKCQENIAYLKSWPSGSMIPFPTITEEKKEKYNMDLNSKLDKNDLEVCVTALSGLPKETIMKIYLVNLDKERYSGKVSNGPSSIHFVAKLSEKEIFQVIKGDKKHLVVRFFKEGFFGGLTQICESDIQTGFTRSNIIEQRKRIGDYEISYVLKVNKPMRPLITQVMHVEVVQHPKYSHDPKVQQEVIKKYLMYSSPTPSQIFVAEP